MLLLKPVLRQWLSRLRRRGVSAQRPPMPQPVDRKRLFTGDGKSRLRTERPHLCQGIGTPMSPFNPPLEPLKYCPGERRLAPCEIFEHQLSPWCQQPPESRERRHWICEAVQWIGADDQIKGPRRVWEACCLTKPDLYAL